MHVLCWVCAGCAGFGLPELRGWACFEADTAGGVAGEGAGFCEAGFAGGGVPVRKAFFLVKKKQKTFGRAVAVLSGERATAD
jgi:hypothetical protein